MIYDDFTYLFALIIIGLFTFAFRVILLFYKPQLFNHETIKDGLESVPVALLVALVIPYTFFDSGLFEPFRVQVLAILLTIPIVYYIKKPGLSLPIAISLYFITSWILGTF